MTTEQWKNLPESAESLLDILAQSLKAGGLDEPRVEARWIVEDVLECDYSQILAGLAPQPTLDQFRKSIEFLDARLNGAPLAHVLGYVDFYGYRFKVAPGILVPRQETELLVDVALKLIEEGAWSEPWVLDCYTGCGNVLLSIMAKREYVHGAGVEIDQDALECAEANRIALACMTAIFVHGDVSEELGRLGLQFNLITANPPYIPSGDILGLQREIHEHENLLALDGGPDGLDQIRMLAKRAPRVLVSGGCLVSEIGAGQREDVEAMFSGWKDVRFVKDLQGHDRVLVAQSE